MPIPSLTCLLNFKHLRRGNDGHWPYCRSPASAAILFRDLEDGNFTKYFSRFYPLPYLGLRSELRHPHLDFAMMPCGPFLRHFRRARDTANPPHVIAEVPFVYFLCLTVAHPPSAFPLLVCSCPQTRRPSEGWGFLLIFITVPLPRPFLGIAWGIVSPPLYNRFALGRVAKDVPFGLVSFFVIFSLFSYRKSYFFPAPLLSVVAPYFVFATSMEGRQDSSRFLRCLFSFVYNILSSTARDHS